MGVLRLETVVGVLRMGCGGGMGLKTVVGVLRTGGGGLENS
jgi:hypothetical protein